MYRLAGVAFCVLALVALSGSALGDTIQVYPNQVPDEQVPRVNWGDAPDGWGTDSWQGPATGKSNLHIYLSEYFQTAIPVSQLASISFWTKKDGTVAASEDWWITIYTYRENDGLDSGSWYDSRLHAHPDGGYSGYSYVADQWNEWSTDDGTRPLKFYDSRRSTSGYFATLDQLVAGAVTLGSVTHDYSDEIVQCITLQTDSGWNGFDGFVDGLTIALTTGEVLRVDLAAVPEPSTVALLLVGLGTVTGVWCRGRRRSK